MTVETITIAKARGETGVVLALCDGPFAVHSEGCMGDGSGFLEDPTAYVALFTLTHRSTGYAIKGCVPWRECLETLRELQARTDLDWSFTDPAHAKRLGAAMKAINATVNARLNG